MKKIMLPIILILFLTFALTGYCVTYTSQYPTQDDDHVKATTKINTSYWPYFATDPAKSLIGQDSGNGWLSSVGATTNQRFHIDLGSAKVIRRIYYENCHDTGSYTTRGAKNFTLWGSNIGAGTFDDLVWGNDEGWTELTVAQNTLDEHTGFNEADPKYIVVTNAVAYRYYALKFADNWGEGNFLGVRRIELQTEDVYTSQYPPAQSDTYVKSTTKLSELYWAYFATDPAKSLTGSYTENSWVTATVTNQRFHIDLGSAKVIRRIYYENCHHSGGLTDRGVKNFTFWGSNDAGDFADLVYINDGTWTVLTVSTNVMLQHVASDEVDPQYITVTNETEYRYYAIKIVDNHGDDTRLGIRRIELQTKDDWLPAGITWNGITITKWNTKTITTPINTQ